MRLKLRGRKSYYKLFESYNIPFIIQSKEHELIEYIYVWRNYFVHNASRSDSRKERQLRAIVPPIQEESFITEVKRLRTRIIKLVTKIDARVKATVLRGGKKA